jgi:hypothetical protein
MENEKTSDRLTIGNVVADLQKFYTAKAPLSGAGYPARLVNLFVAQQTASLQSELSALQERNKKLEEALRELHSCTLYELGPGDERDTHAPWQLFDKVVQALRKESK